MFTWFTCIIQEHSNSNEAQAVALRNWIQDGDARKLADIFLRPRKVLCAGTATAVAEREAV
jgi:hypothetical protein